MGGWGWNGWKKWIEIIEFMAYFSLIFTNCVDFKVGLRDVARF